MGQANKRKANSNTAADLDAAPAELSPSLRIADAGLSSVESPARRMQQQIELELCTDREPRWSARRSVIFLILTNGLFWAGVALAVRAVA